MTNYNLYKTFLVVAETKNITAASELLYVSQPALTLKIHQLEEQIGGELFLRKNKGVELTPLGSLLYEKIKPVISELDRLENLGQLQKNLQDGFLRIGANSSNCNQIISKFLIQFAQKHPNVRITMLRDYGENLVDKLINNQLDIIFTDSCQTPNEIVCAKKFPVVYQLIGNKNYYEKYHHLPLTSSAFPLSELILPNQKNNSRKFIDNYCRQNNLIFTPKYELDNYTLLYDFVKNGLGMAFVSLDYYIDSINKQEVYLLSESTKIKMREFSVYLNKTAANPAKDEFIKILNSEN